MGKNNYLTYRTVAIKQELVKNIVNHKQLKVNFVATFAGIKIWKN